MIDSTMQTFSVAGTVLVGVAVIGAVYFADEAAGGTSKKDPFANMVVIDAAIAEKSTAETKQPQQETRQAPDPVKPVGVTHDENAKPVTNPEPPKPPPPDKPNIDEILRKNRSNDDEDLPVSNKPRIETGRLDGEEVGFGDKTYGNRYLGEMKSSLLKLWSYPEILDETGIPIACVQFNLDGTIGEVTLGQSSGNQPLDDSVERALDAFKDKVNKDPKPLPNDPDPAHNNDLTGLARMKLCWRLKV